MLSHFRHNKFSVLNNGNPHRMYESKNAGGLECNNQCGDRTLPSVIYLPRLLCYRWAILGNSIPVNNEPITNWQLLSQLPNNFRFFRNTSQTCSGKCHCDYVMYSPVCSESGETFVSPCRAGCRNSTEVNGTKVGIKLMVMRFSTSKETF